MFYRVGERGRVLGFSFPENKVSNMLPWFFLRLYRDDYLGYLGGVGLQFNSHEGNQGEFIFLRLVLFSNVLYGHVAYSLGS